MYRLEPFATWINGWFCDERNTRMAQAISAMTFGILLSPWGSGLFFLVVSIIIGEILAYIFTGGDPRYYNTFTRASVVYCSIFGYIVGRTLSGDEILKEGTPELKGFWK